MKRKTKFTSQWLAPALAAASMASGISSHAQNAVATLTDTAVAGGFDYTIVLQNTGSTDLNGFWYGWTDNGNNLPSDPGSDNLGNNLGWDNNLDNNSIQWQNNTGSALSPGDSGTFTFFSTDTPSAITTLPAGNSVAYVGAIQFDENNSGESSPVFAPTLVPTPEPSPVALMGLGALAFLAFRKRAWRFGRN